MRNHLTRYLRGTTVVLVLILFEAQLVQAQTIEENKGYCAAMSTEPRPENEVWQNEFLKTVSAYRKRWEAHDYLGALEEIKRAESMAIGKPISPIGQGELYVDFGTIVFSLGDFDRAEYSLMYGISKLLENCTVNSPMIGKGLNAMANLFMQTSRTEEAIDYLQKSLVSMKGNVSEAYILNNLAQAQMGIGRYGEAERSLDSAEASASLLKEGSLAAIANIKTNRAALLFLTGHINEALDVQDGVVEAWAADVGKDHQFVAHALNNRGEIYRTLGQINRAKHDFEQGLAIVRSSQISTPHILLNLLSNSAKAELDSNHPEKALELVSEARQIIKSAGFLGQDIDLNLKQNQAMALLELRRTPEALALLEEILERRQDFFGELHPSIVETIHGLTIARLRIALDIPDAKPENFSATFALSNRAVRLINEMTSSSAALLSTQTEFSELKRIFRPVYEFHLQLLWDLGQLGLITKEEAGTRSFAVAQTMKRLGAASVFADLDIRHSSRLPQEVRQTITEYHRLILARQHLLKQIDSIFSLPDSESQRIRSKNLRNKLAETIERITSIQQEVKGSDIDVRFKEGVLLSPKAVASHLKQDEALLVYLALKGRSFGWLVDKKGVINHFEVGIGVDKLEELISSLRDSLTERAFLTASFDTIGAHDLYRYLIKPVEMNLDGIEHLHLVTDGPLSAIPFGVMIRESVLPPKNFDQFQEIDWLTRKYSFTTLPAVFAINPVEHIDATTKRPLLVLAAPTLPLTNNVDETQPLLNQRWQEVGRVFASLDHYREKIEQILSPVVSDPARDIISGDRLSESALKDLSNRDELIKYRVLSFFAHGFMGNELSGLREPGLLLAPTEATKHKNREDGFLFASEIEALNLNSDWVILGACDTASRNSRAADSLDTLARAFFRAGTRSVAVSHWTTRADVATEIVLLLSDDSISLSGRKAAQKLQELQIRYSNEFNNPSLAHPFLWAPFTVVGIGSVN